MESDIKRVPKLSDKKKKHLEKVWEDNVNKGKQRKASKLSTDELLMKYLRQELEKQDNEKEQQEETTEEETPEIKEMPPIARRSKHKKNRELVNEFVDDTEETEQSETTEQSTEQSYQSEQSTEQSIEEPIRRPRTARHVRIAKPKPILRQSFKQIEEQPIQLPQPVYQPPQPKPQPPRLNNRQLLTMINEQETKSLGSAPISIFRQ
jgi:hypothetical protein